MEKRAKKEAKRVKREERKTADPVPEEIFDSPASGDPPRTEEELAEANARLQERMEREAAEKSVTDL